MRAGSLEGANLTKVFADGTRALDGVSFTARPGRVLTLLGPSGCGKSTLLRIIAGLDRATSGTLTLDGQPLDDVPPGRRDVGFVFQNYALYPHLVVRENLDLALRVRRVPSAERESRVRETAAMLGIDGLLERRPGQLSGGQQQRVALGRALVRRPRLQLLDEPLSNLDAALRETMRGELRRLFHDLDATVIYVTHDQAEAMSLSDEIAVMRAGQIVQLAPPAELYQRPGDRFVASFVGSPRMTLWQGRVDSGEVALRGIRMPLPEPIASRQEPGSAITLGIRPEDVQVSDQPVAGGLSAERLIAESLGPASLLTLRVGEEELRALAAPREWPDRVWVQCPAERWHWFDGPTGIRLATEGR
jgi:multiple sugar transport system ATP-binding protein